MTIIGTLDIRDWDLGCFLTLGSEIVHYTIDGDSRAQYVVDVENVNSDIAKYQNKIPVFFDSPEEAYVNFILPSFVFKQNDYTPAFDRQPYAGVVARGPSKDSIEVTLPTGETGYSKYESQLRADPYDMTYDLSIYARRKQELNYMVKHVMGKMHPPYFNFKIVDSLGDVRYYDAGEMSFSNSSELADIADRTMMWTVSFTVKGEIDTFEGTVSSAMVDPRLRYEII